MEKLLDMAKTVPGMLIIAGAVLLFLAMILFIIGNKKSKKEKKQTLKENEVVKTEVEQPVVTEEPAAVEPVQVAEPEVKPVEVEETKVEPQVEVKEEVPEFNLNSEPQVVEQPAVVEPVQVTEPVVEEPKPFDMPVFNQRVANENHAPYGGANPTINLNVSEEKPSSVIYGGADPLEKTQSIPKVEENHVPYGGAEIKFTEPVIEPMVTEQPAEPAFSIPEYNFEQPVEIPVEEPVQIEPVVEDKKEEIETVEEL